MLANNSISHRLQKIKSKNISGIAYIFIQNSFDRISEMMSSSKMIIYILVNEKLSKFSLKNSNPVDSFINHENIKYNEIISIIRIWFPNSIIMFYDRISYEL